MTILLDGAMGTELERRGARMELPLWSARALLDDPGLVRRIHADYLDAGAQVISTNTFRTHARDLRSGGLAAEASRLSRLAVTLAREARERRAAIDPTIARAAIAGSMSPLEDCFAPERSPVRARALPEHREIAHDLAEAGADLLLIETMGRIDECCAAIEAAAATGLPVWLSVVGRSDGALLGGEPFTALIEALDALPRPTAVRVLLVNCTQLADLPAVLPAFLTAAGTAPAPLACGLFPHTGHSDPVDGWRTHAIGAVDFAKAMKRTVDDHPQVRLVGSCCGSTPEWTALLAAELHPDASARARGFAELDQLLGRPSPTP